MAQGALTRHRKQEGHQQRVHDATRACSRAADVGKRGILSPGSLRTQRSRSHLYIAPRQAASLPAARAGGHERHVPISIWARLHLGGAGRLSFLSRLASRSRLFLLSLPRESLKVSSESVAVTMHRQSLSFASTTSSLQSGRLMLDLSHLLSLQGRPQRSQPELPTWAAPGEARTRAHVYIYA